MTLLIYLVLLKIAGLLEAPFVIVGIIIWLGHVDFYDLECRLKRLFEGGDK